MWERTAGLDETTAGGHDGAMPRMQGFAGERISVLPRPLVREALGLPLTSRLLVTDCGYFPAAADHRRDRPSGSPQAIVIFCAAGAGWCRLPSGRYEAGPGQALLIPPGVPHSYGADARRPWTIWWLHLAGADAAGLLGAARTGGERPAAGRLRGERPATGDGRDDRSRGAGLITGDGASAGGARDGRPGGGRPVIDVADSYRAVSLIEEALSRMERDDSAASRQAAAGAAWHLLALLAADRASRGGDDVIEQAKRHLREHIGTRIGVAELAALARLSPSHFAALFRRATGVGVLRYQTRLRMARARELLDTTDLPIGEIARRLGYPDPFYFSRRFRSVHGVTATEYRAQHKG